VRPLRFAAVGVMNTAVDWLVFNLLILVLGAPPIASNAVSYACGVANSFMWNRAWTFRGRTAGSKSVELYRFVATSIGGLVVSTATLGLLTRLVFWLGIAHATLSPVALNALKMGALVASLFWNYLILSRWVFPEPGAPPRPTAEDCRSASFGQGLVRAADGKENREGGRADEIARAGDDEQPRGGFESESKHERRQNGARWPANHER
jgi:putative flippase GtrA